MTCSPNQSLFANVTDMQTAKDTNDTAVKQVNLRFCSIQAMQRAKDSLSTHIVDIMAFCICRLIIL